jgi:cytochrome c556
MKIYILIAAVFAAWSSSATAQDTKTTADNPIKAEMRLLNDAFHNLINSIILNNPKAVEEPFHEVHRAKANTEKALERGDVRLPKNNDKIKQFIEMDKEFHENMEILIKASRKGDMNKVQKTTHELLNGCIGCHNKFRN